MFTYLAYSVKEMIARAAKIQFNRMKSPSVKLYYDSVKYNYFACRLARCPSTTPCTTAQLTPIINLSVPSSRHLLVRPYGWLTANTALAYFPNRNMDFWRLSRYVHGKAVSSL